MRQAATQVANVLDALWSRTLNSVKFGILLMVLLALYVGVGSGLPEVRAYFELTDVAFFNAWPMKVLAALLVLNLLTVSLDRIPFTLPRLGVWTIHLGIITLVFGMTLYFSQKVEGMTLVRMGEEVNYFYDSEERALYVTADSRKATPIPLPDLPRFEEYAEQFGNADRLDRDSLRSLSPTIRDYDPIGRRAAVKPLHEAVGATGTEPLEIDIVGYWPYAVLGDSYAAVGGELTGLKLHTRISETGEEGTRWAVAEQPGHAKERANEVRIATIVLRHLHRTDGLTGDALASAARVSHEVHWHVGETHGTAHVEPGVRVELGETGYAIEGVAFLPGFPLFGSGEPADVLEILVHPPTDGSHPHTFRRYLVDGQEVPTDFVLTGPLAEGAGPKGKRQETPVDAVLETTYVLADALDLLPKPGEDERQTFLTKPDRPGFWRLVTRGDRAAVLEDVADGRLELFLQGQRRDPHTQQARPFSIELDIERHDGVLHSPFVTPVPGAQRDRDAAMAGTQQVAAVRLRRGDWETTAHVAYSQWPDLVAVQPARVDVPGFNGPVKLQLGNTRRDMPARVRLDGFELVPYAGDFTNESAMRDFRSHLTIEPLGQEAADAVVRLNKPHYMNIARGGPFGGLLPAESWLLFQSQWDPENQSFTVLGVGNRPGITTMIVGCCMVVAGLMWAFYVKPVILRRRKAAALAAAGVGDREDAK